MQRKFKTLVEQSDGMNLLRIQLPFMATVWLVVSTPFQHGERKLV
jgi:hypothetical protein